MRNARYCLLIIAALIIATSARAEDEPRERALAMLKAYSPTGFYIIDTYARYPRKFTLGDSTVTTSKTDFMTFVKGSDEREIAGSLNTAVHEICHGYTGLAYPEVLKRRIPYESGARYHNFYIGGTESILVKGTTVFKTNEMASTFGTAEKTFRFKTYVATNDEGMGSQQDGIYGLLDEMNAYYHGTRTSLDLWGYYGRRPSFENLQAFFDGVNGSYYAWLEFKLFIAKYLVYAKKEHPSVHAGIIGNTDFKKAYTKINRNNAALVSEYFRLKQRIAKDLAGKGFTITENDDMISVTANGETRMYGNFLKTLKQLAEILNRPEYVEAIRTITL